MWNYTNFDCTGNTIVESTQWLLPAFCRYRTKTTEFHSGCWVGRSFRRVSQIAWIDTFERRFDKGDSNTANVPANWSENIRFEDAGCEIWRDFDWTTAWSMLFLFVYRMFRFTSCACKWFNSCQFCRNISVVEVHWALLVHSSQCFGIGMRSKRLI